MKAPLLIAMAFLPGVAWGQDVALTPDQVAAAQAATTIAIKRDLSISFFSGEIWACQLRPLNWVKGNVDAARIDAFNVAFRIWTDYATRLGPQEQEGVTDAINQFNKAYAAGLLIAPGDCQMADEMANMMDAQQPAP